jgi:hypothetical protein
MDRLMHSVNAFVYPGECEKIEITSEECDRVFKAPPSDDCISGKLFRIFLEIDRKRKRQDEKWGEQNHPMLNKNMKPEYLKPTLDYYRRINDLKDDMDWRTILLEEVCEAFLETEPEKQREEMVKVAAVAVQIIECLDRRIEEAEKDV